MADRSTLGRVLVDLVGKAVRQAVQSRTSGTSGRTGRRSPARGSSGRIHMPSFGRPVAGARGRTAAGSHDARRGEMATAEARPRIAYSPVRDDDADPGEIVWAWVPYEEDPTQGKDRPLLVIGHIEDDVAALALTSRERDDRHHHPLGSGPWDRDGRPSWIKLDRLLRLDPDEIRREGAVLDERRFREVVQAWERY